MIFWFINSLEIPNKKLFSRMVHVLSRLYTVGWHYIVVQYKMISHTALQWLLVRIFTAHLFGITLQFLGRTISFCCNSTWFILGMGSTYDRRLYYVTPPLIGSAHTDNDSMCDISCVSNNVMHYMLPRSGSCIQKNPGTSNVTISRACISKARHLTLSQFTLTADTELGQHWLR